MSFWAATINSGSNLLQGNAEVVRQFIAALGVHVRCEALEQLRYQLLYPFVNYGISMLPNSDQLLFRNLLLFQFRLKNPDLKKLLVEREERPIFVEVCTEDLKQSFFWEVCCKKGKYKSALGTCPAPAFRRAFIQYAPVGIATCYALEVFRMLTEVFADLQFA